MGIDGVGFARIPGAPDDGSRVPVDGSLSWAEILRNSEVNSYLITISVSNLEDGIIEGGVDFLWTAGDNSTVIAHWLMDHYTRGLSHLHKIMNNKDSI